MQKGQVELSKLILDYIGLNPHCSSREIHEGIVAEISYATVKRAIQILLNEQAIVKFDNGKATKYEISRSFSLLSSIDTELYFKQEIDKRKIINSFNQSLITNDLANISLFREEELLRLSGLQNEFKKNLSTLSKESYKKEFERLAIDLSWKSSQIEGNTYSLLETERLLKEQKHADGKTRDEATMLLNHKAALDFILEEPSYIQPLSVSAIEDSDKGTDGGHEYS
jgi:Fic family protein